MRVLLRVFSTNEHYNGNADFGLLTLTDEFLGVLLAGAHRFLALWKEDPNFEEVRYRHWIDFISHDDYAACIEQGAVSATQLYDAGCAVLAESATLPRDPKEQRPRVAAIDDCMLCFTPPWGKHTKDPRGVRVRWEAALKHAPVTLRTINLSVEEILDFFREKAPA